MSHPQPGILAPLTPLARYLTFRTRHNADLPQALAALQTLADGDRVVVGLGKSLLLQLGVTRPALPGFPAYTTAGVSIPSTPADLWCWLRGDDRGELLLLSQMLEEALAPGFEAVQVIDGFKHQDGRDLSGYEDGTENPEGDDAAAAALVNGQGDGLDGGSVVAVQQWRHDMAAFRRMSGPEQDDMIGRRRSDNEELADAPASAHVKRTAQESFTPEAFVLRRSMPWAEGLQAGLMFVAFGHSAQAFAAQLRRMAGVEDGIADVLFRFTRPVTGAYFWCPPMRDGVINLPEL
ncbi:MAG TPA: Dyp-type peroxidase [Fluviicoccus sp.]|nr:Dyp-type peroxidase [Fluviicoccus sp.]